MLTCSRSTERLTSLSQTEIRNKLKTLTQGKPSDSVLDNMARTFKALSQLADFTEAAPSETLEPEAKSETLTPPERPKTEVSPVARPALRLGELVYNIQLILPDSRDQGVYDAFFKSLKEHLLR